MLNKEEMLQEYHSEEKKLNCNGANCCYSMRVNKRKIKLVI